jgi:MATE family multidrug resistance protein
MALSSVFWIFNFLDIGTQTEVAQASGAGRPLRAARMSSLACTLGMIFGTLLAVGGYLAAFPATQLLGAEDQVQLLSVSYIRIRLLGAPAVLVTIATFGALRGLQDMRTPLRVAVGINILNILLDAVLIFGLGPIPAFGVAGAAGASALSWWIGAVFAAGAVYRRLGRPDKLPIREVKKLLRVGGDLFARTGLLTLFLLLGTRTATRLSADAGAVHQVIRQVWVFTSFSLDAFAIAGQSLVAFFIGAGRRVDARKVAARVCQWSVALGGLLAVLMIGGRHWVAVAFVPLAAVGLFAPAWLTAAVIQPISALSFATDGIHWGTGDFRYLRNVVALATLTGVSALMLLDTFQPSWTLTGIWAATGVWVGIRALFGMMRIWPGIGKSPLKPH